MRGRDAAPSEIVTEPFDETHETLNHEGPQVKQNTKAADAWRRDRRRRMPDRQLRSRETHTGETDRCPEAANCGGA